MQQKPGRHHICPGSVSLLPSQPRVIHVHQTHTGIIPTAYNNILQFWLSEELRSPHTICKVSLVPAASLDWSVRDGASWDLKGRQRGCIVYELWTEASNDGTILKGKTDSFYTSKSFYINLREYKWEKKLYKSVLWPSVYECVCIWMSYPWRHPQVSEECRSSVWW